jgi:hypothetical protein
MGFALFFFCRFFRLTPGGLKLGAPVGGTKFGAPGVVKFCILFGGTKVGTQ